MERAVAIKKLGKLLGKSVGYRVDPKAPTRDQRDEAKLKMSGLIAAKRAAAEAVEARRNTLLRADAEYQDLLAAWRAADKHVAQAGSIAQHYKITVGTSNGMFFSVKAQGDSWEDIFEILERKAAS